MEIVKNRDKNEKRNLCNTRKIFPRSPAALKVRLVAFSTGSPLPRAVPPSRQAAFPLACAHEYGVIIKGQVEVARPNYHTIGHRLGRAYAKKQHTHRIGIESGKQRRE